MAYFKRKVNSFVSLIQISQGRRLFERISFQFLLSSFVHSDISMFLPDISFFSCTSIETDFPLFSLNCEQFLNRFSCSCKILALAQTLLLLSKHFRRHLNVIHFKNNHFSWFLFSTFRQFISSNFHLVVKFVKSKKISKNRISFK